MVVGCASHKHLRTELADPSDVTGTFNLILYGCRNSNDIQTVAILEVSGTQYTFEPFAPSFDFNTVKDISAKEALEGAKAFVSHNPNFRRTRLNRILDPGDKTVGYEVSPLYFPFVYGVSDVIDVDYWLKSDGRVKITVRLKSSLDSHLGSGGFCELY
jgi:hypothetical protein